MIEHNGQEKTRAVWKQHHIKAPGLNEQFRRFRTICLTLADITEPDEKTEKNILYDFTNLLTLYKKPT